MKYFVALEKKEVGAPVGFTGAILQDQCAEKKVNFSFGDSPWYQSRDRQADGEIFKNAMFLIVKERLISYDFRCISSGINIVSSGFLELLNFFNVAIKESCIVKVINKNGIEVSRDRYFAIRFDRSIFLDHSSIFDSEAELIEEDGRFLIKRCILKNIIAKDVFKISKASALQDPIFFSEDFVKEAELRGLLCGIEFVEASQIEWAREIDADLPAWALDDVEQLLFIN